MVYQMEAVLVLSPSNLSARYLTRQLDWLFGEDISGVYPITSESKELVYVVLSTLERVHAIRDVIGYLGYEQLDAFVHQNEVQS